MFSIRRHLWSALRDIRYSSQTLQSVYCCGEVSQFSQIRSSSNKGSFLTKFWKRHKHSDASWCRFRDPCCSVGGADKGDGELGDGGGNGGSGSGRGGRPRQNRKSNSSGDEEGVVVVKPEDKFRSVLVIELNRRPLMPGTAMPVVVSNAKLVEELTELKKAGYL